VGGLAVLSEARYVEGIELTDKRTQLRPLQRSNLQKTAEKFDDFVRLLYPVETMVLAY
jgi:hypothetical protein